VQIDLGFRSATRALTMSLLAAALLAGCAAPRGPVHTPDFSAQAPLERQMSLQQLAAAYRKDPKDRTTLLYYAAALRASGQAGQASAILEEAVAGNPRDPEIKLAFAKSLTDEGRFAQALNVIEQTIVPQQPDWNALSVKGAILDQMGRNQEARQAYRQAMTLAPTEASLHANLGLSYALTNELPAAEASLRQAAGMQGATSKMRQNLALVVGLQGRFDEARRLYMAELPPDKVEANMAYITGMLSQQNSWETIRSAR